MLIQRSFKYCHILRQNVVLLSFSKSLLFSRGMSMFLIESFNNNVIVCWTFMCFFSITTSLPSTSSLSSTNCLVPSMVIWIFVHHHHRRAFIFLTWTHLQIVSNAPPIFHKHNISYFYDCICFQTHQPIHLHTFAISKKHAFDLICIKFALLFIQKYCINKIFEHTYVYDVRPPPAACFYRYNGV